MRFLTSEDVLAVREKALATIRRVDATIPREPAFVIREPLSRLDGDGGGLSIDVPRRHAARSDRGLLAPARRSEMEVVVVSRCNRIALQPIEQTIANFSDRNIQHTVRYTELTPDRFNNFW